MKKNITENVKIILDFNALKCYTLTERIVRGMYALKGYMLLLRK